MDKVFENVDSVTSVKEIHSLRIYSGNRKKDSIPFFTIAIPTFNRASTLTETIDSALNQNGFDDYDIIVVDNNPERGDETEVLMNQYRTNPKVTYYKNTQNLGMAGNWNKCALLAKKALMRPIDSENPDPFYADLEKEMLEKVNKLGIGPQGFGGKTTAIGLNIETMPTHIAGMPCAVNINCHVTRHKTEVI